MKRFVFALGLVVVVLALATAARADERSVVIPNDDTPFTVMENEFVRLAGQAIAGGNVEAKVEGPAKVESESVVTERVKGKRLIGTLKKEFEIKPTGKGTVKVTITVTSPIPGSEAKVTEYEFEVK